TEVVHAPVDSLKSLTLHYRLMDLILSIIPFAGSVLMAYYTYENYRYVNVCLPGVFHCERFNFIVPRRIRLVLAIGAAVVLAVLGILFILNMYLPALIISLMGLVIGVYGIYLQVSHRAYCMYCLTTDIILLISALIAVLNL
nr:hypothetical protein [Vulcanisaeta sp.]